MKTKNCRVIYCLITLAVITGCAGKGVSSKVEGYQSQGVAEVLEEGMAEYDEKINDDINSDNNEEAAEGEDELPSGMSEDTPSIEPANELYDIPPGEEGVDVDLTVLSSTMVYGEVYNMMVAPESYVGKTVKMDGLFSAFHDETTDKYYFACIIQDATACCAQGIEFELTDEYSYPDDYPEEGGDICVIGVFDTYEESGNTYCTLRNARLDTVTS